MTNSAINTANPIAISSGGTGISSFAHTNGTVIYNGTDLVSINPGTLGQVLLSNGTSAPSFQTVSGAGEWILLQTVTANNTASSLELTGFSTYNTYAIVLGNLLPTAALSSTQLTMALSTNGGSSYLGSYTGGVIGWPTNGNSPHSALASTNIPIDYAALSTPASGVSVGYGATWYLYNMTANAAGIYPSVVGQGIRTFSSGGSTINLFHQLFAATTSASIIINALQLNLSSGNFISGTASLYALVQ